MADRRRNSRPRRGFSYSNGCGGFGSSVEALNFSVVHRRRRSALQRRPRWLQEFEPVIGKLRKCDSNSSIRLEVDLTREEDDDDHEGGENPRNIRKPRIRRNTRSSRTFVNLNDVGLIDNNERCIDGLPQCPFNASAWKCSMRKKIEPLKSGVSEFSFMLDEGVLNNERMTPCIGGKILGSSEGIEIETGNASGRVDEAKGDVKSERVSVKARGLRGQNNDTDEISVLLELNGGGLRNCCKKMDVDLKGGELVNVMVQCPVPCNAIESGKASVLDSVIELDNSTVVESKKLRDVSCKDSELRVMIPLLDDSDNNKEICQEPRSSKKRRRKRAGRKRRKSEALELDKYLDTNIIDKYIQQLWKKLPKDKQEHCTYLDCLWFSMYLEETLSFKILKWIKEKRIFSKRYVFIPIVHWGHWNLLILCNLGEDFSSEVRAPCMLLLDSLKDADPRRLEPLIRKFLLDVHEGEGRQDSEKLVSKIPLLVPDVPQQTNGNDCGVFLLHFIDLFLKGAPDSFSTSEGLYPYFLTTDWFKLREIRNRRKHINDILLKEQDGASQIITRRISTRSKRSSHVFLSSGRLSNWIDLSSAA